MLPQEEIDQLAHDVIPEARLPVEFLGQLDDKDRTISLQASLLLWGATASRQVPQELIAFKVIGSKKNQSIAVEMSKMCFN